MEMIEFIKASNDVQEIMNLQQEDSLKSVIVEKGQGLDDDSRREFYRHMNSLFLNILLNRIGEFGKGAESRAIEARSIIASIINDTEDCLDQDQEVKMTDQEIKIKFIRGFGTQLFSILLCFTMLCLSIYLGMVVSPILFAVAIWCGTQDAFWMCAKKDGDGESRNIQFEFWFYHLSRMWSYSLGFFSFVIEYLIYIF